VTTTVFPTSTSFTAKDTTIRWCCSHSNLLELDGDDWRPRPLEERKAKLAKLLSKVGDGIYLSEHLAGDGGIIFEHACRMGLEGIVSKRRDFPYRSGRSKCWIKVKNPTSPAALRKHDGTF
jgi:bifunctional non-homologous end joining protein LigD